MNGFENFGCSCQTSYLATRIQFVVDIGFNLLLTGDFGFDLKNGRHKFPPADLFTVVQQQSEGKFIQVHGKVES